MESASLKCGHLVWAALFKGMPYSFVNTSKNFVTTYSQKAGIKLAVWLDPAVLNILCHVMIIEYPYYIEMMVSVQKKMM